MAADKLKPGRVFGLSCSPGNAYFPRLQRFPQGFEDSAVELRQLIQEQDAVVRQRYLSRARLAAATHQGDRRGRVVWRAHRAVPPIIYAESLGADGMNRRRGHGFLLTHGRQDAGQALCQHRFTAAGGTDHHQVVTSRRTDFQGALGKMMGMDIRQVRVFWSIQG